jgi:ABC-type phosphonate transport system ATPase subunit
VPPDSRRPLRGEEWLEGTLRHLTRHSDPGVADGNRNVIARCDVVVHFAGNGPVGCRNRQQSAVGHRITGIQRQIEDCSLNLARLDHRRPQLLAQRRLDADALAMCGGPQQRLQIGHQLIDVGRLDHETLPS